MGQKDPGQALLKLAEDLTGNRSKIGRLRGVFAEIEIAHKAGASNSKIVETLNECGFELTLKTFESMMYRIRKERQKSNKPKQSEQQPSISDSSLGLTPTMETTEEEEDLSGLTAKQRRERKADKFMNAEQKNPLLQRILDKGKNKDK